MLNFNEFVTKVKEVLPEYLPESHKDAELIQKQVMKHNETYTGLAITKEAGTISPVFSLEYLYEIYSTEEEGDFEQFMEHFREVLQESFLSTPPVDEGFLYEYENVKARLIVRLCNTERNKDFLAEVPHKEKLDLSVTYAVMIEDSGDKTSTLTVKKEMMEKWGVSLEQLHEDAVLNSRKVLPPMIRSLSEVVMEMMGLKECKKEKRSLSEQLEGIDFDDPELMLTLSNTRCQFGAATILYPGVLEQVTDKLGDFFLIPSSIEEVILVPAKEGVELDRLEDIIHQVNSEEIDPKIFLSDSAYFYSAEKKTLELAREHFKEAVYEAMM